MCPSPQTVDKVRFSSLRTSDRCHWCGNPFSLRGANLLKKDNSWAGRRKKYRTPLPVAEKGSLYFPQPRHWRAVARNGKCGKAFSGFPHQCCDTTSMERRALPARRYARNDGGWGMDELPCLLKLRALRKASACPENPHPAYDAGYDSHT